jgi:hypothetical protein
MQVVEKRVSRKIGMNKHEKDTIK